MNEIEALETLIKGRRSVFPVSYIQKEIPESVITQILKSANYAPTHKLTQPWRFVVLTNAAKTRLGLTMANLYKAGTTPDKFLEKKFNSFSEKTAQAGCIIAINIQFHPDKLPAWEEIAATACAVQNMALTAQALKIGTYWSSPAFIANLDSFLGLAENEKCYGLFYMGYHNEAFKEANRTPIADKIKWLRQ
jgi:nitroreductase